VGWVREAVHASFGSGAGNAKKVVVHDMLHAWHIDFGLGDAMSFRGWRWLMWTKVLYTILLMLSVFFFVLGF
jgi:hypothetical protein